MLREDDITLLTNIGFTKNQAKLYLTLINYGKTDVKTLAKQSNVPRQAIYRTLNELQQKGIVEKIISLPQEYKAAPFRDGLSMIMSQKTREYKESIDELTKRFADRTEKPESKYDYSVSLVEGKNRLIHKTRISVNNSMESVKICTTISRWISISEEIQGVVEEALGRGVKFRAVLEMPNSDFCLSKELSHIITHPNYEVRALSSVLRSNSAVFDGRVVSFNYYPSKSISDSPMIWTNHPSFVVGSLLYFRSVWEKAIDYQRTVTEAC